MEFDNNRPIYIQLLEEFKLKISSGQWRSGEKMDTVRNLAESYMVNPNTVQRALQELEREGLAKSNRTSGRFVTDDKKLIKEIGKSAFYESCDELIDLAKKLDIDKDEAIKILDEHWREEDE